MTISINAAARAAHRWGRLSLLRPERCAAGGHRSWRARRRAKPLGNCTRASRGARMPMAWADGEQPSPRGNERPRMDDQATTSSCDYPQSASDPPSLRPRRVSYCVSYPPPRRPRLAARAPDEHRPRGGGGVHSGVSYRTRGGRRMAPRGAASTAVAQNGAAVACTVFEGALSYADLRRAPAVSIDPPPHTHTFLRLIARWISYAVAAPAFGGATRGGAQEPDAGGRAATACFRGR